MPQFKDNQGREWTPKITVLAFARFEASTGKNLFDNIEAIQTGRAIVLIFRLAYHACERQAKERRTSFDDFCEAFDSDILVAGLSEAVGESLLAFFQSGARTNQDAAQKKTESAGDGSTSIVSPPSPA